MQQDVWQLQISVYHVKIEEILQTANKLLHHDPALLLRKGSTKSRLFQLV